MTWHFSVASGIQKANCDHVLIHSDTDNLAATPFAIQESSGYCTNWKQGILAKRASNGGIRRLLTSYRRRELGNRRVAVTVLHAVVESVQVEEGVVGGLLQKEVTSCLDIAHNHIEVGRLRQLQLKHQQNHHSILSHTFHSSGQLVGTNVSVGRW